MLPVTNTSVFLSAISWLFIVEPIHIVDSGISEIMWFKFQYDFLFFDYFRVAGAAPTAACSKNSNSST